MTSSRRHFLRSLGMGTAAGAAAMRWPLETISAAQSAEPIRPNGADGFLLLNSNENPYGPSARVANAIRGATGKVNRYAFLKYDQVTEQIANHHRVKPERILFGCGSTELLRVAACAFLGNSKKLIQALPTFEALENYAKSLGSEVTHVHIDRKFAHDLEGMLSHADASTGLVYICNPNNPTANITPRKDIEAFLKMLGPKTYVLIDEAYHHFAMSAPEYASFIDQPVDNPRVIVARTFSKIYGLAGMRLGYAVAAPSVAKQMREFAAQDNVNMVAAQCGVAGLQDVSGLAAAVRRIAADRDDFIRQAQRREMKVIPSQANFAMMETGKPIRELIGYFKKNNVLIGRPFHGMENYARISFGTPEQMKIFWQTWDKMPS